MCLHVPDRFVFSYKFDLCEKAAFKKYNRSKKEWLLWQLLIVSVSIMAFIGLDAIEGAAGDRKQWFTNYWSYFAAESYEIENFQFQQWNKEWFCFLVRVIWMLEWFMHIFKWYNKQISFYINNNGTHRSIGSRTSSTSKQKFSTMKRTALEIYFFQTN